MWLILFYLASGCLAIQPNNTPQYRPGLSMNEDYPAVFPAPDPQYKEDPLPGIPDDLKEYLKLDFGQGYYEPKCNNPERRPYIEPVYYWPGDTIKLKCRVCEEEQANNGKIKNWAFLDRKIAGKIDKLHLTIKNKNWLPIQQLHTKPPRPVLTPEFTFSSATPIHRPNPHAYQRDGFLIITNSVAATYGLYRCFDYDKTDNLDYIYYLIPYTPILVDSANQRTIRPEYEILERESYKHFDEYHRWRTYPTFIQDKKNGICAGECNDKYLDVSHIKTPVTKWEGPVIRDHDVKKLTHKINLEVYFKWDNWTSCENGMDMQTRVGQCYLRKTRPSIVFKRDLDPLSGKEKHVLGEVDYALTLHKLLENVPAFKQDGFPLFTGILMDAMLPKNDPFDVSTKIPAFEWQSFYDFIIKGLLKNSVRKLGTHGSSTELGPCLRKRGSALFILNSHILFQNRKCK